MVATNTDQHLTKEEKEELEAEQFTDVTDNQVESTSERELRDATLRIIVQRNDFLLPKLMDMLLIHKTLEVSPTYQRRSRWDIKRKSRLIESFWSTFRCLQFSYLKTSLPNMKSWTVSSE